MNVMTPENELVVIPDGTALTVFTTDKAIDPLLERVRKEIDSFVPDISTPTGRKAVASMAYKVARAKTYLDDAGKRLADEQKAIPKKIDACRKHVRDTLDAWRDEVRKPLTDWEAAEDRRIANHRSEVERIGGLCAAHGLDAAGLRQRLEEAEAVSVGEHCEEFLVEYVRAKEDAIKSLRIDIVEREKYEAEQAELARLRAEAEARERKEREERIAAEAAERAKRDAEAKAEADRKAAEESVRREREAAERRELELKLQAEAAERRAVEAEAKARHDAEQKAERERIEAVRREADKAHRAKINKAAMDAFVQHGIGEEEAKRAVTLIALREIPHVSISY